MYSNGLKVQFHLTTILLCCLFAGLYLWVNFLPRPFFFYYTEEGWSKENVLGQELRKGTLYGWPLVLKMDFEPGTALESYELRLVERGTRLAYVVNGTVGFIFLIILGVGLEVGKKRE